VRFVFVAHFSVGCYPNIFVLISACIFRKYEYKGRRWKRISKAGKAFVDDLLVVDPDDRATTEEAMKASWLNRRFGATVRNPKAEEMNSAKDSLLRYAGYSKLQQLALMGTCTVFTLLLRTRFISVSHVMSFMFFCLVVIAHKSTSSEIGMLRKIFQQFDTDGIGHLNYEQFKGAIADPELTEADYRRIFDAVVRERS
jgi:serine/threonine protein kinase